MTITYSEYVFVALGIQLAKCTRHIVICGLSGSTIFFYNYLTNSTIFGGGGGGGRFVMNADCNYKIINFVKYCIFQCYIVRYF